MRNSTISSSIVSVVCRVINVVAIAGTVRSFLHLAHMRGHMGYWREPCQLEFAYAGDCHSHLLADLKPGKPVQPCRTRRANDTARTVFATPSRLTTVRAIRRG